MALSKSDALGVELVDVGTQKSGRYRKRMSFYAFRCISCEDSIRVASYDLKKVSGRCVQCAAKHSGPKRAPAYRKRPYEALFNKFVYDRKRFGQENSLTYEEFVFFTETPNCTYCGTEVRWAMHRGSKPSDKYNLDRMDNTRGYHKDNLTVCCWECNQIKSSRLTHQEMMVAMKAVLVLRAAA